MVDAIEVDADVVVVGAGIAGALIAYKLAKRGLKVKVFEAGKRFTRADILKSQRNIWQQDNSSLYPDTDLAPRTTASTIRKDYMESVGPTDYHAYYLRGVGGTTWHWQAVCHRFLPEDMKLKTNYNIAYDWPFEYDELEPYYAMAEVEIGVGGNSKHNWGSPRSTPYPLKPVVESYAEKQIKTALDGSGIQFVSKPAARNGEKFDGRPACEGHHNCSNMCPIGAQYSAIVHVEKSEALGVEYISEALVTSINIDADNSVASIEIKRPDNSVSKFKARAYVLAANPIETVRLCLASVGEYSPNGVANSSKLVGRRLMDHPIFDIRFSMPDPVYAGRGPLGSMGTDKLRAGSFRRNHASSMLSFENVDLLSEITTNALQKPHKNPLLLKKEIYNQAIRRVVLAGVTEQLPDENNRVFLDDTRKDSTGMPHIKIHYDIDDYTKNGLLASKTLANKVINYVGGSDLKMYEGNFGTHASGTMMMGDDPVSFVTDSDGRTHDHKNLFVAGASLFPSSSAANPTLTIAALALRTEEKIATQLGTQDK